MALLFFKPNISVQRIIKTASLNHHIFQVFTWRSQVWLISVHFYGVRWLELFYLYDTRYFAQSMIIEVSGVFNFVKWLFPRKLCREEIVKALVRRILMLRLPIIPKLKVSYLLFLGLQDLQIWKSSVKHPFETTLLESGLVLCIKITGFALTEKELLRYLTIVM